MCHAVRHAYGQSRMQARFSRQVSLAEWLMLEDVPEIEGFLQHAQTTHLAAKVARLPANPTPELLEKEVRRQYRNEVDEVASWQPVTWQEAVRWVRVLPDIPAVVFLMRGGYASDWMLSDPELTFLATAAPEARFQALLHSLYAPLAACWRNNDSDDNPALQPVDAWHAHWISVMPVLTGGLAAVTTTTRRLMQGLQDQNNGNQKMATYCANQYRRIFRQYSGTVVAAFAYLAMSWIELIRLRGNLLTRSLFLTDKPG